MLTLAAGVVRRLSAPDRYSAQQGDVYDASFEQNEGRPRTAEVGALPAVARVDAATFVFGGLVPGGAEEPVDALVFVGTPRALGGHLVEGREPDPATPGEFVATRAWVDLTGASLGDELELLTISQSQADERGFDVAEPEGLTLTATLVGVSDSAGALEEETPLALFPVSLLDAGDVGVSASVGFVALTPGSTLDDLRGELDALPGREVFAIDAAEWVPSEIRSAVSAQGQGLAVVAAIAAIAAVAVVGQVLSRQARLPEGQRRALTSIGLTRAQLVADPVGAAAIPIVGGSIGAAILAFVASGVFPAGLARRIEPNRGAQLEPLVHVAGAVAFAVVLVAWVAVAIALGDRPLRDDRLPGGAEKLAGRVRPGPGAIGLLFVLSRHPRDPGSVRAPLVGLVLVLSLLVGALTFGASMSRFVDEPARWGMNFDLGIGAGGNEIPAEVRAALRDDPDVAALALYGTILATVGAVSLDVTAVEAVVGDLWPDVLGGSLPVGAEDITLGRVAARELGVEVGEDLVIVGTEQATFHVSGLAVIPGIEGGDGLGDGGLVTVEGLHRLDPDATLSAAGIELRKGSSPGAAERISAATGMGVGLFERPPTVINLARVRSTPFLVVMVLAALALVSIAHQLIVSTSRRRRDLAVLRALGADRRWVSSVLHWQATVLSVVVLALAMPLGVAAGRLVYQQFIDRVGARHDISVPFALLGVTALALVLVANAVAVGSARRPRLASPARVFADE